LEPNPPCPIIYLFFQHDVLGTYKNNVRSLPAESVSLRLFSNVVSTALIRLYVPSVVRPYVYDVLWFCLISRYYHDPLLEKLRKTAKSSSTACLCSDYQTRNLLNMKQGCYKLDRGAMYCHVSGVTRRIITVLEWMMGLIDTFSLQSLLFTISYSYPLHKLPGHAIRFLETDLSQEITFQITVKPSCHF
jgi:hypothetical protein